MILIVNHIYEIIVNMVDFRFCWVYYKVEAFFLGGKTNVSDV